MCECPNHNASFIARCLLSAIARNCDCVYHHVLYEPITPTMTICRAINELLNELSDLFCNDEAKELAHWLWIMHDTSCVLFSYNRSLYTFFSLCYLNCIFKYLCVANDLLYYFTAFFGLFKVQHLGSNELVIQLCLDLFMDYFGVIFYLFSFFYIRKIKVTIHSPCLVMIAQKVLLLKDRRRCFSLVYCRSFVKFVYRLEL